MIVEVEVKKIIDEITIWDFINKAEKVLFPIDINPEWRLIAEYIPYGEPQNQYRLYKDSSSKHFYAKIHIATGQNL